MTGDTGEPVTYHGLINILFSVGVELSNTDTTNQRLFKIRKLCALNNLFQDIILDSVIYFLIFYDQQQCSPFEPRL